MTGTTADLLQEGIAAAKAKRIEEARRTLMRVVELDDHNEQAWLWLSGVVESNDDRRVCLENVLEINPDNTIAQSGLHWLNEHAPVKERCPHCNAPLPASGDTCPSCKQPVLVVCPACDEFAEITASACPHCRRSLGNYRQGARYYIDLAEEYLERDKRTLVIWAIDCAEAAKPNDPEVLGRMAEMNARFDRHDNAIRLYRQAITLAPNSAIYTIGLGTLYRQQGMHAEARALYQQAAQRAPNDPTILVELAQSIVDGNGSAPEAIDLLERAAQIQPDVASVHAMLGKLYVDQNDKPAAFKHYSLAVELTEPTSLLGGEARREVTKLQAALPKREGRGDFARQMIGLMFNPVLAALSNARLSPLHISLLTWIALIVSALGSYLWLSATDLPRNPLTQRVFGSEGVRHHRGVRMLGLVAWLVAFAVILVKV